MRHMRYVRTKPRSRVPKSSFASLGGKIFRAAPRGSTTGYVRQAYDSENNVQRDPKARSKVDVMLCTGLEIINNAEHSPTVDLLDEIVNDWNGVAHPAKLGCSGSMDAVIKNLEHYQASNPLAVTPKEKVILSILKQREN